jgi:hypothetical protein
VRLHPLLLLLCACLAGCAHFRPPGSGAAPSGALDCGALYAEVDRTVHLAGVEDGGSARVESFPYLRVDRLLATFRDQPMTGAQLEDWAARMGALDRYARAAELANLPAREQERLREAFPSLQQSLERCRDLMRGVDLQAVQRTRMLRERARVPDDYDTWKRAFGLYWLTRLPFNAGVEGYQREVQQMFDIPLERLTVDGRLVTYAPAASSSSALPAEQVAAILARAADNPLRIPKPTGEDAERLFRTFAPRWAIDERDANDRIGRLVFGAGGMLEVDAAHPVVYRRLAHTRAGDATLLQLVYSVWFPARPKSSPFDLLAGRLDGVVWRVTLASDGAPLVYDSIHSCGCYHQFFPTARAEPLPQPDTLDETAFVPQQVADVPIGQRIVLRIQSRTHYLQRVSTHDDTQPAMPYELIADDTLRSLPHPDGGQRSAFRADGIVPGSQRGERYFFWPMGVRQAGAMRQWGRHATAFIGRRHFDEARLLERYFRLDLP